MNRNSLFLAAWRMDKKLPLIIVGLLLLNIGALTAMNYYVSPRVEKLEREYIEQQASYRQSLAAGQSPGGPQDGLRAAQEDLQAVWEAIPPRKEFTVLIGELFTLAQEAGLNINQISYDPEGIKGREMLRYSLSFSVAGDYGQIKRFIHSLEQSDRLLVIEDIALIGTDELDQNVVRLSLRLSTLFRTGGA